MLFLAKGKYFKYQSEFRILDDRIYLTKNSPQKYESLATIDDDHNVIEIANGLRDITSEILPIEEMLNPNQCKVPLVVNWENLRFQDFVLYNNPRLAELQGMKKWSSLSFWRSYGSAGLYIPHLKRCVKLKQKNQT